MLKSIVTIILFCSLFLVGFTLYRDSSGHIEITNAFITGKVLKITAPYEGTIAELRIKKGDFIQKGELLFRISTLDTYSNIDFHTENLRNAVTTEVKNCVDMHLAIGRAKQKEIELQFARNQYSKFKTLSSSNAVSVDELQSKKLSEELTELSLSLSEVEASFTRHINHQKILQRAPVRIAQEGLKEAYKKAYLSNIYAPYSGYVYEILTYPAQYVETGSEVLIFIPSTDIMVEANILETQLQFVSPGAPVEIVADVLSQEHIFKGLVHSVVPTVTASLSPFPRNYADSNWIKVSQRIPILVSFDYADYSFSDLPVGSSVKVLIPRVNAGASKSAEPVITNNVSEEDSSPVWEQDYRERVEDIFKQEIRDLPNELLLSCNVG